MITVTDHRAALRFEARAGEKPAGSASRGPTERFVAFARGAHGRSSGRLVSAAGVQAYRGARLTVTFEAARFLHATECIRGLPEVSTRQPARAPGRRWR